MADQRLECLPIAGRMPAGALDQPEQPRWAAGVQPRKHPPGAGIFQLDVIGAHQLHGADIDQSVPEHVGAQQHLTVAAFEAAKVNLVLGQHNPTRGVLVDGFAADEHVTPADTRDDPGHQRVLVGATQAYDHVLDPAHSLAGSVHHRGAQQL